MLETLKNEELLDLMSRGNIHAFEEIYTRYASKMFLYAINILNNKEVCEDIIQNIYIDIWTKREGTVISNLSSYLFRAVKYQIFNHLRNQKISTQDLTRLNIIDASLNASKQIEYAELEETINTCVSRLPKRCQQIFVLSRHHNKSNKEIALELGISLQAVKNQISKALKFIRQNLQQEEPAFYFIFLFGE